MPIKVTYKFEMLILKGSQVIKYYVMFAFLFVQTVHMSQQETAQSLSFAFAFAVLLVQTVSDCTFLLPAWLAQLEACPA